MVASWIYFIISKWQNQSMLTIKKDCIELMLSFKIYTLCIWFGDKNDLVRNVSLGSWRILQRKKTCLQDICKELLQYSN